MSAERGTFLGAAPGSNGDVVVIGLPYCHGSARGGGTMHGPGTLRLLTRGESIDDGIWDYRTRTQIIRRLRVADYGDIPYRASLSRRHWFDQVESLAHELAQRGIVPLALGGDHTITLPMARGVARALGRIQVVQLDAHHDYAPIHSDTHPTHSNFIAFLAAHPGIARIIQVGVRGYSSYLPVAPQNVVDCPLHEVGAHIEPEVPTYLTIDTDALDPCLAPAVMHPQPGGLTWDDVDRVIFTLIERGCPIVGVDWTEYDPELEGPAHPTGIAVVAALVRVLASIERQRSPALKEKESGA